MIKRLKRSNAAPLTPSAGSSPPQARRVVPDSTQGCVRDRCDGGFRHRGLWQRSASTDHRRASQRDGVA
jgi:hypothetical protein